jgi:hypothetical protein
MKTSEAVRLIAMLAAAFRQEVSEETAALWANEVSKSEVVDVVEAIQIAMTSGRFMPSLAEFMDLIRDCRNVRLAGERSALPDPVAALPKYTFAQFLADHPDQAERVKRLTDHPSLVASALTQLLLDEGVKL